MRGVRPAVELELVVHEVGKPDATRRRQGPRGPPQPGGPRQVAIGDRDRGVVVEGQGDPGDVAERMEQSQRPRCILAGVLQALGPDLGRADHMERPGLHRPIADPPEDL